MKKMMIIPDKEELANYSDCSRPDNLGLLIHYSRNLSKIADNRQSHYSSLGYTGLIVQLLYIILY
jgi:hypothetical protein